jgi:carbamoyltransferase
MITLGINAVFHDSAAALVIDGQTVAAAEEERFTRIKHAKRPLPFSTWELPFHAIDACLAQAGLVLADVDHVAYSFDPLRFAGDRADLATGRDAQGSATITLPLEPSARPDPRLARWDSPWDALFLAHVVNAPRQLADGAPHHLRRRLGRAAGSTPRWRWHFVDHHLCHQASAFLAAPFAQCAVMTLDGRGERATTGYGVWRDGQYRALGEVAMPHSLGLLYEQVTSHLGFLHSSDEYKVMALAAMGRPVWAEALGEHLSLQSGGRFELTPIDLGRLAGPPRVPGSALEARHFDLAASVQQVLESTVLALASWLREASGTAQLAMAGGVALNCVMNARLRDEGPFDAVWIQPAAGDAGTALGAALWTDARARLGASAETPVTPAQLEAGVPLAERCWTLDHAYLGPAWSDEAIAETLRWAGLDFETLDDDAALVSRGAELLARGCILGWFQGRMEWGPRALGARSILASPIDPAMQARLNGLKDREDFRPVAPAVTAEAFADWFSPAEANGGRSPFMLFTHQARPGRAERIPSACHSDGSARVQTVHADSNPRFHALLRAFERRTGVPVLVNTSFNVRGQPVVCSPKDALEAFFTTPLDALLIGRHLLCKPAARAADEASRAGQAHGDAASAKLPLWEPGR